MEKEKVGQQYMMAMEKDLHAVSINRRRDLGLMIESRFEEVFWPRAERGIEVMKHNGIQIKEQDSKLPYLVLGDNVDLLAYCARGIARIRTTFLEGDGYPDLRQASVACLASEAVGRAPFLLGKINLFKARERWFNNIDIGEPIVVRFSEPADKIRQLVGKMAQSEGIQIMIQE